MATWWERYCWGVSGAMLGAAAVLFGLAAPNAPRLMKAAIPPALSEGQEPREHYRGIPPPEFRADWIGTVKFVDDVSKYCGPPEKAYACFSHVDNAMIMPNPCTPDKFAKVGFSYKSGALSMMQGKYDWLTEDYRTTVCHELGHAHGWPGNHWIASETEIAQIRADMLEKLYEYDQTYGGVEKRWLMNSPKSEVDEEAIAQMVAAGEVQVHDFVHRGLVVRLDPCKYWTMRQEREGDGEKLMRKWCPEQTP